MAQQPILSFVAVDLLVIGLIGNGFEMRRIRLSTIKDEELKIGRASCRERV